MLGGAGEDVGGSLQGGAHGQLHGYGNMLMSSIFYEQVLSIAYRGARGGHQLAGSKQLLYGAGQVQLGHPHIVLGRQMTSNYQARYLHGNKQNQKGIKNLHLNIRSLLNKVCEVKNIIREQKPHIFGLSECELKKVNGSFNEEKLKIPGYNLLFPKSWSEYGYARVVTYVKKSLQHEQVHELEDEHVQTVWLKGGFKNSKAIYFCHGYREHTSSLGASLSDQRNLLEKFLFQWEEAAVHTNPSESNEVHISGDMNLDILDGKWLRPDYPLVTLSKMVQTSCTLGNFSQLVTVPTRFQYNRVKDITSRSCIDHVYCNTKHRCSGVTVMPFGGSDHDVISYIRYTKVPPAPSRTLRKRSYKKFVQEDFVRDMNKVDWSEVYQCDDVDVSAAIFTRKFVDVLNLHAPWVIFQLRNNYSPWITNETKDLMKTRDGLKKSAEEHTLADEYEAATEAWENFITIRNKVNNRKKFEEEHFKSDKIKNSLDSPTNSWSTAKSFMNWKSSGGPPSQLNVDGELMKKASLIAQKMNEFFIEKVRKIREGILFLPNTFEKCREIMENKTCSLGLRHVTLDKVSKLLKNLKNSKSSSIDELDNFCVKVAADSIARPLHHIITLSILQTKFPSCWKYSKVIPLHKKECKLERKNYRPVAILSPLSKILEKVVYEQLYDYLTRNKIFHPNLHGYRQNRSTQTALLTMYDRWVKAAVAGQVSGVVLLDLSAAFDLVDPDILIQKLRIYGLEENFTSWIHSYLTCRHQAVWVDHVLSDFVHCEVGVPQGSNLGPLFSSNCHNMDFAWVKF